MAYQHLNIISVD